MSFEETLSQLRKAYLGAIPEKSAAIESHRRAGDVKAVRTEFHKLKGTGLTYGFPEISRLAELGEKICDHTPMLMAGTVPEALAILARIQHHRLNSLTAYPLDTDSSFQSMQSLFLANYRESAS